MSRNNPTRRVRGLRPRGRGLTFVELLLALSITTIIGAAVASMLFAVSRGTESRHDIRSLVVRRKMVDARVSALFRSAKMVLAHNPTSMVLWMYDTNNSGTPNRAEIRFLEWDSQTRELWAYKTVWPGSMSEAQITAANTEFALSADFNTIVPAFKGNASFVGERWATGISAVQFVPNLADLQAAGLVSYSVTVHAGPASDTVTGAAALRNTDAISGAN